MDLIMEAMSEALIKRDTTNEASEIQYMQQAIRFSSLRKRIDKKIDIKSPVEGSEYDFLFKILTPILKEANDRIERVLKKFNL